MPRNEKNPEVPDYATSLIGLTQDTKNYRDAILGGDSAEDVMAVALRIQQYGTDLAAYALQIMREREAKS